MKMEKIKDLLTGYDGELHDLCYKLLAENKDKAAEIFEYACKIFTGTPKDRRIVIDKYFTEAEVDAYEAVNRAMVDGILLSTIRKCDYGLIEHKLFYNELWNQYCKNFASDNDRALAFYYTLVDNKMPYHYLGKPLSMSNDTYSKFCEENKQTLDRIRYIFINNFPQSTETASLILHCLNEVDSFESKTVILARALWLHSLEKAPSKDIETSLIKRVDGRIRFLFDQLLEDAESFEESEKVE